MVVVRPIPTLSARIETALTPGLLMSMRAPCFTSFQKFSMSRVETGFDGLFSGILGLTSEDGNAVGTAARGGGGGGGVVGMNGWERINGLNGRSRSRFTWTVARQRIGWLFGNKAIDRSLQRDKPTVHLNVNVNVHVRSIRYCPPLFHASYRMRRVKTGFAFSSERMFWSVTFRKSAYLPSLNDVPSRSVLSAASR